MPIYLLILILAVLIGAPLITILIFHSGGLGKGYDPSSKAHLKKDEFLEVKIKSGRWKCPSCNDTNLEIKDDCGSCGQKIKKTNQ